MARFEYNCARVSDNDVRCKIDNSTFTLDVLDRTWIGPGDYLEVKFPTAAGKSPKLLIVDGERPKLKLKFNDNGHVPFVCQELSKFTQYFTFSVAYHLSDTEHFVWQVEVIRDRIPDIIPGKKGEYQSQVNFFFNRLFPAEGQPGPERGSGGGFQRV